MTTIKILNGDSHRLPSPVDNRPVTLDLQQAVSLAQLQWPSLAGLFDVAANLVGADRLYFLNGEADAFSLFASLTNLPETSDRPVSHLIFPTATGLSCTCPVWTPRPATGPGDGRYCPDILALLLQIYLERPFHPLPAGLAAPPPYEPAQLWQEALAELRYQMTRAVFTSWLAGSYAIAAACSPDRLTVAVASFYAQEWLRYRLYPAVARTVKGLAGYSPTVCFVCNTMRSSSPMLIGSQRTSRVTCQNRPVSEHWAATTSGEGLPPTPVRTREQSPLSELAEAIYGPPRLHYADGSLADTGNPAELRAFLQFRSIWGRAPASKAELQAYYRAHLSR